MIIPNLPDFLIIGAAKSGTTSLYEYLGQHPQVYMSPIKEPNFFGLGEEALQFSERKIFCLEDYQRLFARAAPTQATGEASHLYLYHPRARERIRYYLPNVKLIAILRQPADRAFSHYLMNVRLGLELLPDFSEALRAEPERKRQNWNPNRFYRERGYYYRQLAPYYAAFSAEQIRVFLYDDLQTAPLTLMQSLFRFLEVDDQFIPDLTQKHNEGGTRPKNRRAWVWLRKPNPLKTALKAALPSTLYQKLKQRMLGRFSLAEAQLPSDLRADLTAGYREDILQLQELIARDLSHWLK
jgi:hypothetical protein